MSQGGYFTWLSFINRLKNIMFVDGKSGTFQSQKRLLPVMKCLLQNVKGPLCIAHGKDMRAYIGIEHYDTLSSLGLFIILKRMDETVKQLQKKETFLMPRFNKAKYEERT